MSPPVLYVSSSKSGEVYHPENIRFILHCVFSGSLIAFIVFTQFNLSIDINHLVHQFGSIVKFALSVEFLKQRTGDQVLRFQALPILIFLPPLVREVFPESSLQNHIFLPVSFPTPFAHQ